MLQAPFYHKTIRKIVAAFGTMFNNIMIVRTDVNGVEIERIKVPLSYASKEKFITNLAFDSTLTKPIQVQLPRMSFEMEGLSYDSSRKLQTINKTYSRVTSNNNLVAVNYSAVPYDFSFSLSVYTRTIEEASQIVEQIVPYFTPDYTVTVALVDDGGVRITRDIPIILEAISPSIDYGTDEDTPRYVIYTFNFTVKAYMFGPTTNSALIKKAITSIYDTVGDHEQINLTVSLSPSGAGNFRTQEPIYSGNNWSGANWTASALYWSNTSGHLTIYNVDGRVLPTTGDIVIGLDSGARWTITSTNRTLLKHAQTVIVPKPNTANIGDANVSYSANTTEFPTVNPNP